MVLSTWLMFWLKSSITQSSRSSVSRMLAFLVPQEAMSQKLEANTTISGSLPVRFLKLAMTCVTHTFSKPFVRTPAECVEWIGAAQSPVKG